MYRVIVERSAEKDLRRLPLDARFRVADALRSLAKDPRPVGSRQETCWNEARLTDSRRYLSRDPARLPIQLELCEFIASDIVAKVCR